MFYRLKGILFDIKNLPKSPLPVSVSGGSSEPGVCSALARCLDAVEAKCTPLQFAHIPVSLISWPPDRKVNASQKQWVSFISTTFAVFYSL